MLKELTLNHLISLLHSLKGSCWPPIGPTILKSIILLHYTVNLVLLITFGRQYSGATWLENRDIKGSSSIRKDGLSMFFETWRPL